MKTHTAALLLALFTPSLAIAQDRDLNGAFMVGVNLGELPWGGSFKPGISLGYHVNELAYVGVVYQVPDTIQRDDSSFNASDTGLGGLQRSSESVGQRFLLHARLRPHRYSPFVSVGAVFNDTDTETSLFADGTKLVQQRSAGLRPSLGVGYEFTFDNGISLSTEWSGWVFDIPSPKVSLTGGSHSESEKAAIRARVRDNFEGRVTNAYHLFMLGAGYTF